MKRSVCGEPFPRASADGKSGRAPGERGRPVKNRIVLILCAALLLPCLASIVSCSDAGVTEKTAGDTGVTYVVTFRIENKEYAVSVPENATPVLPEAAAAALSADKNILRFIGWDKEFAAVTEDTTYTARFGNFAKVLPAKDGAKGIFTMTYDDGQYDTAKWVWEENKKYGLTGSCMLIAGRTALSDNLDGWAALFADGTLEPESHSMNHDTLPAKSSGKYEEKKGNNTQAKYKIELVDARARLQTFFPEHDILCFAPASNTLSTESFGVGANGETDFSRPLNDGGAEAVARATYYAIRQGARGIQSFDPTFGSEAGGWYNLRMQGFSSFAEDAKLSAGKSWLDDAVKGGWLIVMCHGIGGPNAKGTSPVEISEADADAFFAYAGKYVESGDLWSATFGEATKYLRERQNTTVSERLVRGVVYLDMTINRTAADGKYLDEAVFDYPLTVTVRVPDGWNTVAYVDNRIRKTAETSVGADGYVYATVNVTPGKDGKVTSTAIYPID